MTECLDTWSKKRGAGNIPLKMRLQLWWKSIRRKWFGERSLISGLDPSTLAIILDTSHYDGDYNLKTMRAGGVSMIITKACDGVRMYGTDNTDLQNYVDKTMRVNIQKCYDVGIPCGVYIYVKTYWSYFYSWTNKSIAEHHYNVFKEAVKGLVPGVSYHLIAIDFEEEGQNDYNTNIILGMLYDLLRKDPAFANLPIIWYSSMRFYNLYPSWMTTIASQGTPHNFWMAQWAWTTDIVTTWEYLKTNIIAKLDMKVVTPGFATWKIVQVSGDAIKVPGDVGAIDLNLYKGTEAQLYTWLNFVPPEPKPEPVGLMMKVTTTTTLNVRSLPATSAPVVGRLKPGDVVQVLDVGGASAAWIKHAKGWSCVQLGAARFMEVDK